jgi:hypothetical protein
MSTGAATLAGVATLEVHICDQRRAYKVTFATETQAIAFLERRTSTHAFWELEGGSVPADWTKLLDFLYPTCEHGLSASLCYGPAHYASDLEIAQGW